MTDAGKDDIHPLVTIIIPVYNAASTLPLCLESIRSINYPADRLEVIVVDNGSIDGSDYIARNFGVTILYETAVKSSYAARNKGIKEANGELIAFTDSDCIVTPDWLKYLVREWNDKNIGCFAGEIEAYQAESLTERFSDRAQILRQKWTLNSDYLPYTQTANSAYRREVFDKIGLFIPDMASGGDADIAWRMQKIIGLKIKFIPEAVVYHKHRTTIIGLFRQFKKYEEGKLHWKKYYPDYKLPSVGQRCIELYSAVRSIFVTFPNNIIKYMRKQIDIVDLISPFLRFVMSFGTFVARL